VRGFLQGRTQLVRTPGLYELRPPPVEWQRDGEGAPAGGSPAAAPADRWRGASPAAEFLHSFPAGKWPSFRRGQCDSRLHDLSEEATPLGQCPRPIPTRRGVPGNRGVSELEGKAEPTCQPLRRGEARGRSDGFNPKPRYERSPEVASTAIMGNERGDLSFPRGGHLAPG
jgi:hypothetical protein